MRRRRPTSSILQFADLTMNVDTHEVWRDEISIELTATEFNLLRYLWRTPAG